MKTLAKIAKKYIKHNMSLLELGCGNCALLNELIQQNRLSKAVGIDLDQSSNFPESAKFIKMNLENFSLHEKFDVIILDNVLEHLKTPILLLENLKENLNPNGTLLIVVPNRRGWGNEAKVYLPYHGKYYTLYDEESLSFTLKRLGYSTRTHNLYGQTSHSFLYSFIARLFNIQNPTLIMAAFVEWK